MLTLSEWRMMRAALSTKFAFIINEVLIYNRVFRWILWRTRSFQRIEVKLL